MKLTPPSVTESKSIHYQLNQQLCEEYIKVAHISNYMHRPMCIVQVPFLLIIGRFMGGGCKSFSLISESHISGLLWLPDPRYEILPDSGSSGLVRAYKHVPPGGRPP